MVRCARVRRWRQGQAELEVAVAELAEPAEPEALAEPEVLGEQEALKPAAELEEPGEPQPQARCNVVTA